MRYLGEGGEIASDENGWGGVKLGAAQWSAATQTVVSKPYPGQAPALPNPISPFPPGEGISINARSLYRLNRE